MLFTTSQELFERVERLKFLFKDTELFFCGQLDSIQVVAEVGLASSLKKFSAVADYQCSAHICDQPDGGYSSVALSLSDFLSQFCPRKY